MKRKRLLRYISTLLILALSVGQLSIRTRAVTKQERLDAYVQQIIAAIPADVDTDAERALYLHDYLVLNVSYQSGANDQTAYGALVEGKAVCAGYANAYKLLLDAVGIQSAVITGQANNGYTVDAHAWNMVILGGACYFTDVTWDDPIGYYEGSLFHAYYNLTLEEMSLDHFADSSYSSVLPSVCNHSGLDFYTANGGVGTGYGVFNDDTAAEDAMPHFVVESVEDGVATLRCEFRFEGTDASTWMSSVWAAIGRGLGMSGSITSLTMSYGNIGCLQITGALDAQILENLPVLQQPNIVRPEFIDPTDPPSTTMPTTIPETTVPETTVPETTVPETTVSETTVPETTVPEMTVPETTVPEMTVPETTVPETTVPETTVPETTVPETTAHETAGSDIQPTQLTISTGELHTESEQTQSVIPPVEESEEADPVAFLRTAGIAALACTAVLIVVLKKKKS